MNQKRILIVDDEQSILTVLKNSLEKLGPDYEVVTASDGFVALDAFQQSKFDLVVTDYNMARMDGVELLEAIHYLQPAAPVIMITAYGSEMVEADAGRFQAYSYLTKPLEIKTFRQIVQKALGMVVVSRPGMLTLSDERYRQIGQAMDQLRKDVSARCLFLADVQGHIIARSGDTDRVRMEEIASLLGASMAGLSEAGRTLNDDQDTINLAYREGKTEHLYALTVDQNLMLILIIGQSQYSSRLGTVWYYAYQVALSLRRILNEADQVGPQQIFTSNFDQAFEVELDKLFDEDNLF